MKKNIDVFDFNEEDELAESAAEKLLEKFTNPSPCNSPVLQRQRIRSFCNEKRAQKDELEGPSCAEPATAVGDHHCEDAPTLVTEAEESSMSLTSRLATSDPLKETDAGHVNHGLMSGLNTEDLAKETDVDHDSHGLMSGLDTEDLAKETDVDHANHGLMSGLNTEDLAKGTDVDHDNHGSMFGLNSEDDIKETDVVHGLVSLSCQPGEQYYYAETSSYSQRQLNSPLSDSSSSEQNDMMSAVGESLSDQSALSQASDSEGDEDVERISKRKPGEVLPPHEPDVVQKAVNHFLQIKDGDVMVIDVRCVPSNYHARYKAQERTYFYRFLSGPDPSSITEKDRAWHVPEELNIRSMQEACRVLVGSHDFSSFRASGCQAKSPMRSLDELNVTEVPSTPYFPSITERAGSNLNNGDPLACFNRPKTETDGVTTNVGEVVGSTDGDSFGVRRRHRCYVVTARARAFLYHQVRLLVGVLKCVGTGECTVADVERILEAKTVTASKPMAPACGLYLARVKCEFP